LADGVTLVLRDLFSVFPRGKSFGNARLARNLFEAALQAQGVRLADDPSLDDEELTVLSADDFRSGARMLPAGSARGK
jgi:hypothetical protein